MTAKIISVCNQKGGVGKTTLAMMLAGTLGTRGKKVLVVDADPQGTATRWASSASDDAPFPATVAGLSPAGAKVHNAIKKFVNDYTHIVIDCPPAADSPIPQSALLVSDLALVPVIPSPPDLWAAVGIKQVIESASSVNDTLKARLVVNLCQPNTLVAQEILDILNDFGIPVAKSQLGQRTVYREAAAHGQTVHYFGSRAATATAETDALTTEVLKLLR